jgi:hypothetical protein
MIRKSRPTQLETRTIIFFPEMSMPQVRID